MPFMREFFHEKLKLPIEFFHQRYAGEIGNRVYINDRVAVLLSRDLATTALNLMVIVIYALLMLQYDLVLSLVSVVTRWLATSSASLSAAAVLPTGSACAFTTVAPSCIDA